VLKINVVGIEVLAEQVWRVSVGSVVIHLQLEIELGNWCATNGNHITALVANVAVGVRLVEASTI